MSARRETHDPNTLGIDPPILRMETNQLKRFATISQGCLMPVHVALRTGHPVLQDGTDDALPSKPTRDVVALLVDSE
jgi:hypothetical protein